ncbi:hypothetical protein [Flavobacterium orientale]|uniref:Uncharacterized protein n=1 Tax=Flavobacterium orientale TaxID=1756020 RepID=A0A916XZA1_9FLAO|nr:hypothetical protein [Flavobacterium orientale]GGD21266.1 hypothetical protein GCM10011343_09660 [Flavobacterium orientale]
MKNNILEKHVEAISKHTEVKVSNLYKMLFAEFETNYLDYRAYVFYADYFSWYQDKYFDSENAQLVLNSILNHENWFEIIDSSTKSIVVKKYDENGGFSVLYKSPKTVNRIFIYDLIEVSGQNHISTPEFIHKIRIESAKLNSLNFDSIQKEFITTPTFTRKISSRFEILDSEDQEKWYVVFLHLMKIHFENMVVVKKKEVIVLKKLSDKVDFIIKIDKKSFFKELKLGRIHIHLINSKSVFLVFNTIEYPLELFFPSSSLSFHITKNIENNQINLKLLDVYLASHSYLLNQYFEILGDIGNFQNY